MYEEPSQGSTNRQDSRFGRPTGRPKGEGQDDLNQSLSVQNLQSRIEKGAVI